MTRAPRAFAPDLGRETLTRLPGLSGGLAELISGTAGSSPYLKGLIEGESEWLAEALTAPDDAINGVLSEVGGLEGDRLKPGLRSAKRRIALIVALADLAGAWPLEQVTGFLTDFAGLACQRALMAEISNLIRRGKLPGQTEDDVQTSAGLAVMAMGKMGAHELNYSSDIDLICLFDETRYDPDDFYDARQGLVRATRNMCALLSDRTADGYVFRTDLRLRPDPSVTPVCISMSAAETYYESLGRTWERAAYIKARACAGDIDAGNRFISTLRPFIWRRHLDFAAIQDAHDMRLRIRENKKLGGPITVAGHDMKLGRGGIREIEFFTQTRQLIAGGRDESLRVRGTVEGLHALAAKGWIPEDVAEKLTGHYRSHREVEHRIQMVHDAQTHALPTNTEDLERIACLMGTDTAGLTNGLKHRLTEVHELTEGFFAPDAGPQPAGEAHAEMDTGICSRWPNYPAFRSPRAQQIFERLRPEIMTRLAKSARPGDALVALDGFLAGLPAGVQLFSLFEANTQLIDLLIDIVGTSPALSGYLARNASVFDAVIGGDFFSDWPGAEQLESELSGRLQDEHDYEARLDMARRWAKEWHFRVGVHHLRGLISGQEAGGQYADLADAVIRSVFPVVVAHFAARHGPPPGRGAAVLGMGSLGARRLNAVSDLDLILIYDPSDAETSDGKRPLPSRTYYARLTQALITALSAPMAEGRLYEVDMRLRPSGNQGPVATSWASFQNYQTNEAWVWEHMALSRARVVAGGQHGLGGDIEAFRRDILGQGVSRDKVLQEVRNMRDRIAEAKSPAGTWDTKNGPGRMQDIELIAQAGALLSGSATREVAQGLDGAVETGWMTAREGDALRHGYDLYWSVLAGIRLLAGNETAPEEIAEGGAEFLCRSSGYTSLTDLSAALISTYHATADIIEAALIRENEV